MRAFFLILLVVHGLLHLPAFIRDNRNCPNITGICGWYWIIASLLFISGAVLLFFDMRIWPFLIGPAVIVSQYAIIRNWSRTKNGTAVNAVILFAIILVACGERGFLKHNRIEILSDIEL